MVQVLVVHSEVDVPRPARRYFLHGVLASPLLHAWNLLYGHLRDRVR